MQRRSVELFTDLGMPEQLGFAEEHRAIIERFGRFPHRNVILGRASTLDEIEFLNTARPFEFEKTQLKRRWDLKRNPSETFCARDGRLSFHTARPTTDIRH